MSITNNNEVSHYVTEIRQPSLCELDNLQLNFGEYFTRFEDIFLNLLTGGK